jgi:SAM-dependent methyltransferase
MSTSPQLIRSIASYESVASEYYDATRHPTCANFREASQLLLRRWLTTWPVRGSVCEIGAGSSLMAEIMSATNHSLESLTLIDESPSMLHYSQKWAQAGANLDFGSAMSLPYRDKSFDFVASFLGDPYNTVTFWQEVRRIARPGAVCLFTTPSWDWAESFRESNDKEALQTSVFELADGTRLSLPSNIYREPEQVRLIESAGLSVADVSFAQIQDLDGRVLSPKLKVERGPDAKVVTGFAAIAKNLK